MEGLTDCVYLEASTPEMDDVVRIEDDFNRSKIQDYTVFIPAWFRFRLDKLTRFVNKALQLIISPQFHILLINSRRLQLCCCPRLQGQLLREYLKLAYPNREIKFAM